MSDESEYEYEDEEEETYEYSDDGEGAAGDGEDAGAVQNVSTRDGLARADSLDSDGAKQIRLLDKVGVRKQIRKHVNEVNAEMPYPFSEFRHVPSYFSLLEIMMPSYGNPVPLLFGVVRLLLFFFDNCLGIFFDILPLRKLQ